MKSCHMGITLSSFAFNITVWRPKWSWDILTLQVLKRQDFISWHLRGNPAFAVEPTHKLEGKYAVESTDPRKSEIRAPRQPLPYLMPIPPNTLFYNKTIITAFCR